MDDSSTALIDAVVWTALSVTFGYAGHRLPTHLLRQENVVTRIRPFEDGGRTWQRYLAVRRWKDALPEAGAFFGGVSKKHIRGRADIDPLLCETRRAELVHWSLLAASPLFALWNPLWLTVAMIGFACIANVPCIIVQRFNRARLVGIDVRSTARR